MPISADRLCFDCLKTDALLSRGKYRDAKRTPKFQEEGEREWRLFKMRRVKRGPEAVPAGVSPWPRTPLVKAFEEGKEDVLFC